MKCFLSILPHPLCGVACCIICISSLFDISGLMGPILTQLGPPVLVCSPLSTTTTILVHSPTRGCSCIVYFYFIRYLRFYLSNHTTWTIHLGLFTLSPTTIIFVLLTPPRMLLHSAHLCFIVYLRSYGSDPHHLSSFDHLSWFVHPSPIILSHFSSVLTTRGAAISFIGFCIVFMSHF